MSAFRRRIWTWIGAVCVFVFLPGAVFIYITGFQALAALVALMLAALVLNQFAVAAGKYTVPAMVLFVASLTSLIGLCLLQRGVVGVFWAFPGVLMINFLSFGRAARIYTAAFFVFISAITIASLELPVSLRGVTALGVTIIVTNIFLDTIDKLQRRLAEQSAIDPLTGALNRREIDTIMQDAIERKRRTKTPASILMLDVDEFKSVNDTYGHAVGDHVLKELADLIMDRGRYLDKLFRMGGEEFMVFLPDTTGEGAVVLAEELRSLIAETRFLEAREITVSIGIVELGHGETIDKWMKRGDDALYTAKHSGRNQSILEIEASHAKSGFSDEDVAHLNPVAPAAVHSPPVLAPLA